MDDFGALNTRLARGWNTFNTRSVLSHVLLPEGFALNLAVKERARGMYLKEALVGRAGKGAERVRPVRSEPRWQGTLCRSSSLAIVWLQPTAR